VWDQIQIIEPQHRINDQKVAERYRLTGLDESPKSIYCVALYAVIPMGIVNHFFEFKSKSHTYFDSKHFTEEMKEIWNRTFQTIAHEEVIQFCSMNRKNSAHVCAFLKYISKRGFKYNFELLCSVELGLYVPKFVLTHVDKCDLKSVLLKNRESKKKFENLLRALLNQESESNRGDSNLVNLLSYCTVNNNRITHKRELGWNTGPVEWSLNTALRVGLRVKSDPFGTDDVVRFREQSSDVLPETDVVFQQWASTKYGLSPHAGFILSLSHNHGSEIEVNNNLEFMPYWVIARYLPLFILADCIREKILLISSESISMKKTTGRFRGEFLSLRKNHLPYSVAKDIQDERIWIEIKKTRRLDELLESINKQIGDEWQDNINKRITQLTVGGIIVAIISLFISYKTLQDTLHPTTPEIPKTNTSHSVKRLPHRTIEISNTVSLASLETTFVPAYGASILSTIMTKDMFA